MKKFFWFLTICLFIACQGDKATSTVDYTIEIGKRVGGITGTSTLEDIINIYGEASVKEMEIHIGEGEMAKGVKIFPYSERELELVWDAQAIPSKPDFIRITQKNTPWKTLEGVTIGMNLETLHKVNVSHFLFNGFEWDYGGYVTSWRGGKIDPNLLVTLQPQNYEAMKPQFMGEVELSSDNPEIKALDLQVRTMVFTFLE